MISGGPIQPLWFSEKLLKAERPVGKPHHCTPLRKATSHCALGTLMEKQPKGNEEPGHSLMLIQRSEEHCTDHNNTYFIAAPQLNEDGLLPTGQGRGNAQWGSSTNLQALRCKRETGAPGFMLLSSLIRH